MPELPEVETMVRELHAKLQGKKIAAVEVRAPKVVSVGPETVSNVRTVSKGQVAAFSRALAGQKILSVKRRAKLLIFDLSGPYSLFVHLKMTGQFIFEDAKLRKKTGGRYRMLNKLTAPLVQLPGKHTHVVVSFTDGSTLYYNDMRKFGYLKLVRDADVPRIKELQEFGPEPFAKIFTVSALEQKALSRKRLSVKQFLMDNRVVVGIGNIYSDEVLFHAGVRPTRTVRSLKHADFENIFAHIRPVLKRGIAAKGSSVGDFVRTDGSWGGMGKFHFVYGRKGQECKRCGTILVSVKLGGRTSCYCPHCQT